jgi:hypothetical protein
MGILRALREWRNRKIWGEHLSPELIKLISEKRSAEIKPPEVKHFQFVVAIADETNPDEVPAMIAKIVDSCVQHHATVSAITSSLVIVLLGVPFPEANSADARRGLVDALLRENGSEIRIVHGESDGAVGDFGGPKRWTYGALIPGFSGILKKLVEAKFGTAVEVP